MLPFLTDYFSPASDKNFGGRISVVNCMMMEAVLVDYGLMVAAVVDYELILSGVLLKIS